MDTTGPIIGRRIIGSAIVIIMSGRIIGIADTAFTTATAVTGVNHRVQLLSWLETSSASFRVFGLASDLGTVNHQILDQSRDPIADVAVLDRISLEIFPRRVNKARRNPATKI